MVVEMHASASSSRSKSIYGDTIMWITYINIVLYALCYQLQRPIEPFLVQDLTEKHNDPTQVAIIYSHLQSFFSAIQTVGSPLVGILLDRVGVRQASALVFLASALSYAILAMALTTPLLFLSKVPTALQHAFLVAQAAAAISTGSDVAARAQAFRCMTTAYTIGGTIGPFLGGWVVETMEDLYIGAKLAVAGSLISVALSIVFLPSKDVVNSPSKAAASTTCVLQTSKKRSFWHDLQRSYHLALRPNICPLFFVKIVGGFTASMYSIALPLVLVQYLHFDPTQLGFLMSASMSAVATFGAIAIKVLASPTSLGPSGMGQMGLLLRAGLVSLLAVIVTTRTATGDNGSAASTTVMRVVFVSVLHALASHVSATGISTQAIGAVNKSEEGVLLWLEHGLLSLARIVAPQLASYLFVQGGGFRNVALLCGVVDISLLGLLIMTKSRQTTSYTTKSR